VNLRSAAEPLNRREWRPLMLAPDLIQERGDFSAFPL